MDSNNEIMEIEDLENSETRCEEPPQKKTRKRLDGQFEKRRKVRNKLDKSKIISLNRMLNKWYERTNTPTVALTLLKSSEGQVCVKYSGPKEFSSFGESRKILKKFVDTVMEGMKAKIVQQGATINDGNQKHCSGGIDENIKDILMKEDVFKFPVDDKRKLILQIITGSDLKQHGRWEIENKPEWWPEEIAFRSPCRRNPSMKVCDLDTVLDACIQFVNAILGNENETSDVDAVEDDVEDDTENVDDDVGDLVDDVEDNAGDPVDSREDGREVDREVEGEVSSFMRVCDSKGVVGVGASTAVEGELVLEGQSKCWCTSGKKCAADENCALFITSGSEVHTVSDSGSPCLKCPDCSQHFHKVCVIDTEANFTDWMCGCTLKFEELRSLEKFRKPDTLSYLFRRWNSELKKFVKGILSGTIGSRRKNVVDLDRAKFLSSDSWNFYWLLGRKDSVERVFMNNVTRLAYSVASIRKLGFEKRSKMCRYCLGAEMLAFLLHKEESCSLMYARRILLEDHDTMDKD